MVPAVYISGGVFSAPSPTPGLGSRPLRFGTDCSGAEVRRFRR